MQLIESDLFAALDGRRYDLIISNPPYVDAPSMAALPAEYRSEPTLALASGADGLDHIRLILRQAESHLTSRVAGGGSRTQPRHLEAAFPDLSFNWLEVSAGDEFVFLLTRRDLST